MAATMHSPLAGLIILVAPAGTHTEIIDVMPK
jgi:hypothetical protein